MAGGFHVSRGSLGALATGEAVNKSIIASNSQVLVRGMQEERNHARQRMKRRWLRAVEDRFPPWPADILSLHNSLFSSSTSRPAKACIPRIRSTLLSFPPFLPFLLLPLLVFVRLLCSHCRCPLRSRSRGRTPDRWRGELGALSKHRPTCDLQLANPFPRPFSFEPFRGIAMWRGLKCSLIVGFLLFRT